VEIRLGKARFAVTGTKEEAIAALAELEKQPEKFSPEQQLRLKLGLAEAYAMVGATADAHRLWNQVAKDRPDDLASRLYLLDQALLAGDNAETKRLTGEIRRIEGEEG